MSQLRLGIIGSSGRMGKELLALIEESDGLVCTATVDQTTGISDLKSEQVDVVVDFSQPEGFSDLLNWCAENSVPLISGTTGLTDKQFESIQTASKKTAILWAPNFSLGVNFLNQMIPMFKALNEYEFQITEAHHRKKKDAPSGTALFLQKTLDQVLDRSNPEPLAIRGGGIFGIHKVWAMGPEETITLEHSALNRAVFARGALTAARWIQGKSAGAYSMGDVLSDRLK